jgi:hypothetical protein
VGTGKQMQTYMSRQQHAYYCTEAQRNKSCTFNAYKAQCTPKVEQDISAVIDTIFSDAVLISLRSIHSYTLPLLSNTLKSRFHCTCTLWTPKGPKNLY